MHRFALFASFLLSTACAATPDLTYAGDDATAPVSADAAPRNDGSTTDGAADDATRGTVDTSTDGLADGGLVDSGECASGTPPTGATTCCGTTPCVDRAGNGCDCAACAQLACAAWCGIQQPEGRVQEQRDRVQMRPRNPWIEVATREHRYARVHRPEPSPGDESYTV